MPGKFLAEYTVKGFDKTSSDTSVLIVRGSLFFRKLKKKNRKKKSRHELLPCGQIYKHEIQAKSPFYSNR